MTSSGADPDRRQDEEGHPQVSNELHQVQGEANGQSQDGDGGPAPGAMPASTEGANAAPTSGPEETDDVVITSVSTKSEHQPDNGVTTSTVAEHATEDATATAGMDVTATAPVAPSTPTAPRVQQVEASSAPMQSIETGTAGAPEPHTPLNQMSNGGDVQMADAPGFTDGAQASAPTDQQQHLATDGSNAFFPGQIPFQLDESMNEMMSNPAQLMMAMASMGAPPQPISAMSPPSTVTPAQVSLPHTMEAQYDMTPINTLPANTLRQPGTNKALESFARIEFPDSVFQMTTFAVVIGRDQRALEQARRDEKRAEEHRRLAEERAIHGLPPPSPINHDRSKFSKSYISEEGGMLGPESDSEDNMRPAKRRRTSTAGSSQQDNEEEADNIISERQYISHTPGAAAVDLASLRPSPYHVPFLGIHSSGPDMISKTKAISREHLKIKYNPQRGVFEAIPLHANGFFCEDVHCHHDSVVLKSGDRLQIKDIAFRFIINGVERGRTGGEEPTEERPLKKRYSQGGKEMSFDFEDSHGGAEARETSEELSEMAESPPAPSDLGQDDEPEVENVAEGMDASYAASAEQLLAAAAAGQVLDPEMMLQFPRKRGPGRPPKNGIMSKREQRLLKKQQQELAKKTLPQIPIMEPPIKRKVGRPRKHPLPDDASDRPEKRKYTPRKPKPDEILEGSDAERQAREAKERKARAKSPPLSLNKEDYTEEQLMKPTRNYGVLIDEVLTEAGPDGLSLKQIYKRICQKYPYFYFFPETKGWESSVRHNLLGNKAFHKISGGVWTRVPGIELDAGKKRKTSPPRRVPPGPGYGPYSYPFNGQQMTPGAQGFSPGQAAPGYSQPGFTNPQHQGGQPAQQPGFPAQAPVQGIAPAATHPYAAGQHPNFAQPPPGQAQPAPPQQQAVFNNQYAPRPPQPANPPIKAEEGAAPPPAPGMQQFAAAPPRPTPMPVSSASPRLSAPPQQAAGTPSSGTPGPPRPIIEPRLLNAVVGLKNGLIDNLAKAGNPQAEAIVMSALNRCIGLKNEATENERMEAICIKGIRQVIDGSKGKSPTPGGSVQPEGPAPIFADKALKGIMGFKTATVGTLKSKIGDVKAEAVALSAIDRVLGLSEKSLLAKPGDDGGANMLETVERQLIPPLRQLLTGMNLQLAGAA